MSIWKNYSIVAVSYNQDGTRIERVKKKKYSQGVLHQDEIVLRQDVVNDLKNGITYNTATASSTGFVYGDEVQIVEMASGEYIRTDGNKKDEDNLGELPKF